MRSELKYKSLFDVSQNSICVRAKVGAAGVDHNGDIFYGWNHMKDGSCCEISEHESKPDVLHAECHVFEQSSNINELYVTHSPCINCAKEIHKHGVKSVFYYNEYRLLDGVKYLLENGINVQKLEIQDETITTAP